MSCCSPSTGLPVVLFSLVAPRPFPTIFDRLQCDALVSSLVIDNTVDRSITAWFPAYLPIKRAAKPLPIRGLSDSPSRVYSMWPYSLILALTHDNQVGSPPLQRPPRLSRTRLPSPPSLNNNTSVSGGTHAVYSKLIMQ